MDNNFNLMNLGYDPWESWKNSWLWIIAVAGVLGILAINWAVHPSAEHRRI